MKTMPAGEFKARCLRVMEEVRKYRTPVVITKKGRQVAKLVPVDAPAADVFGCMANTARIVGDIEAPVFDAEAWEAMRGSGPRSPVSGTRRRAGSTARPPRDTWPRPVGRVSRSQNRATGRANRSGGSSRAT
jgi:prevent-host-death family protein